MIFSGSAVVDWHNTSGFCAASGDRPFVPRRRLHRAWPRPADAEPRLQQRPRPDLDEIRQEPGHRPRPEGLPRSEGVLARADAALDHGHRAAGPAQGAASSRRPISSRGRRSATSVRRAPRAACGNAPTCSSCPIEGEPAATRWVLDVDINPGGIAGGSGGQYFVGTFDGTRFVADHPPETTLWVDYGKDFYATLSFSDIPASDGRRSGWGGSATGSTPTTSRPSPWRGAQSVPRELTLRRGARRAPPRAGADGRARGLRSTPQPEVIAGSGAAPAVRRHCAGGAAGRLEEAGVRLRTARARKYRRRRRAIRRKCSSTGAGRGATPFHEEYPGRHAGPVAWRDGRSLSGSCSTGRCRGVRQRRRDGHHGPRLPHPAAGQAGAASSGRATARPRRMWTLGSVWATP